MARMRSALAICAGIGSAASTLSVNRPCSRSSIATSPPSHEALGGGAALAVQDKGPACPARARRARRGTPRASSPKATFSHTVISGNRASDWKIIAVGRAFGPVAVMSSPLIRMRPVPGARNPETARRIVVLPQPDGPSTEKNSPARIVMSVGCTAVKPLG